MRGVERTSPPKMQRVCALKRFIRYLKYIVACIELYTAAPVRRTALGVGTTCLRSLLALEESRKDGTNQNWNGCGASRGGGANAYTVLIVDELTVVRALLASSSWAPHVRPFPPSQQRTHLCSASVLSVCENSGTCDGATYSTVRGRIGQYVDVVGDGCPVARADALRQVEI